jgi:beta-phosphoglucomutase-like phosphatase (HAD superfamily)
MRQAGRERTLDTLAATWWTALATAQSALQAAGLSLKADELSRRSLRLAAERTETVRLLDALARDLQTDSRLIGLLSVPGLTPRLLGLPHGVTACVFDLDGVLTTSAALHSAAWAETFDPFLLERAELSRRELALFDERHDYPEHIAGRPRLNGVRAFLASRGISLPEGEPGDAPGAATVHGLANRKSRALQDRLERQGVSAFAASRCYLEAARLLDVHRAVVSASLNTEDMLARAGLSDLVEDCVDGAAIEVRRLRPKPAPDSLLAACEDLHVAPDQTAVFETTAVGVAAARAAGAKLVVGVDRSGAEEQLRGSDADVVVEDLAELFQTRRAA